MVCAWVRILDKFNYIVILVVIAPGCDGHKVALHLMNESLHPGAKPDKQKKPERIPPGLCVLLIISYSNRKIELYDGTVILNFSSICAVITISW
jgi:hypothetical protein